MLQTKGILDYGNKFMSNPCKKYVSDLEFLKHMIPHHQVAIDMSKKVLKYTTDPNIIYLARNIIFKQSDEILFMENVLLSKIPNLASNDKSKFIEIPNQFTVYYPKESRADNFDCGIHHFDPNMIHDQHNKHNNHDHNNHNNHNNHNGHNNHNIDILTDKKYLEHMIPHHDVAIDMAERIIKYSKKPIMVEFAYEIIKNQRHEIWLMKNYLQNSQRQCSVKFLSGLDGNLNGNLNNDMKPIIEQFNNIRNQNNFSYKSIFVLIICFISLIYLIFLQVNNQMELN